MPWMPDNNPNRSNDNKMHSLPNGKETTSGGDADRIPTVGMDMDIKAVEKRILSSSEHLNEILSLNAILQVRLIFSLFCLLHY